jgi:hypothetical protein
MPPHTMRCSLVHRLQLLGQPFSAVAMRTPRTLRPFVYMRDFSEKQFRYPLCHGQEEHTMRELEVLIANSGSVESEP